MKRLAEFDLGATPTIEPAVLAALATGAWIEAGEPVVLLGDSGTGKTHLLIGLGIVACERAAVALTRWCLYLIPPPRTEAPRTRRM